MSPRKVDLSPGLHDVKKMKKAQGLPTNAIILVVIGLIILVVLVAIFTGKMRIFSLQTTSNCHEQGGRCADSRGDCVEEGYPIKIWAKGCECQEPDKTGKVKICEDKKKEKIGQCCLPLGK